MACVYSVMVAYIISNWTSETAKNLFVGLAVVLIQVPSVYVRSFPLYSYSGTVTGFTTAMLLLTSNATTTFAVNRIIDTYVGVTIYLLLEFGAAATFTEDEILSDMRHVSCTPSYSTLTNPPSGTDDASFSHRCLRASRRSTRTSTATSTSSKRRRTPARRCDRASVEARSRRWRSRWSCSASTSSDRMCR